MDIGASNRLGLLTPEKVGRDDNESPDKYSNKCKTFPSEAKTIYINEHYWERFEPDVEET